jgi:methylthioribose-1-phosphate isomerase
MPRVSVGPDFSPVVWRDGALEILDQTRLPLEERWLRLTRLEEVADAIRRLAVRGAPAIGIAAAYGLALAMADPADPEPDAARRWTRAHEALLATRPTAVNLRWALERGREVVEARPGAERAALAAALLELAHALRAQDLATCRAIGAHGAALFAPGARVLTHCNAGGLATAGYGTAVGVLRAAYERGRLALVYSDETRPLLQGARLTAWELVHLGIPFRLIPDAAAGALIARGEIDAAVVGADRIAANGDTANKIGTYTVAVLCARHGLPFYVAAPRSTIDPATPDGAAIPIEERAAEEVTSVFGTRVAPAGVEVRNPAFDVTPAELITAIVTEVGVLQPPYSHSIARALAAP